VSVLRVRSMADALKDGATDGKYRKARPNTTVYPGDGDDLTRRDRADLHPFWNYGLINQEAPDKVVPGQL